MTDRPSRRAPPPKRPSAWSGPHVQRAFSAILSGVVVAMLTFLWFRGGEPRQVAGYGPVAHTEFKDAWLGIDALQRTVVEEVPITPPDGVWFSVPSVPGRWYRPPVLKAACGCEFQSTPVARPRVWLFVWDSYPRGESGLGVKIYAEESAPRVPVEGDPPPRVPASVRPIHQLPWNGTLAGVHLAVRVRSDSPFVEFEGASDWPGIRFRDAFGNSASGAQLAWFSWEDSTPPRRVSSIEVPFTTSARGNGRLCPHDWWEMEITPVIGEPVTIRFPPFEAKR